MVIKLPEALMTFFNSVYNSGMKKVKPFRRSASIFILLGLAFLILGISTDQEAFSWIAIGLILAFLITNARGLRLRRK